MNRYLIIIFLIIGAFLSSCVGKESITGTYAHNQAEFTFYDDGTFFYQNQDGTNSGVYQIHDKELIITGQLGAGKFIILDNGSLLDPGKNTIWKKK